MIIVFEGIDACGKATHSKRIADKLGATRFSFPAYETPIGRLIMDHLSGRWSARLDPDAFVEGGRAALGEEEAMNALVFQCLQSANKMEMDQKILEAEQRGPVVLDRYWPSACVYGSADGIDTNWLYELHAPLAHVDYWLLLDIDPEQSLERRPERRDRYEKQPGLMHKVAALYREMWKRMEEPGSLVLGEWLVIDARGTKEETAKRIEDALALVID